MSQSKKAARMGGLLGMCWWPVSESNQGHADFQSAALPTELTGQKRAQFNRFARLSSRKTRSAGQSVQPAQMAFDDGQHDPQPEQQEERDERHVGVDDEAGGDKPYGAHH